MIEIRDITDIGELLRWRKEVIRAVFSADASQELIDANEDYYRRHIPGGSHKAYLARIDIEDVGVGGMCLYEELPSPDNPSGRCAYLMNIYVRERFRGNGVGKALVNHIVAEAKRLGCGKIYLESTEMAKPLYIECNFKDMINLMDYEN